MPRDGSARKGRSGRKGKKPFTALLASRPVIAFLALFLAFVLVVYFRQTLASLWSNLVGLFGLGLVILALVPLFFLFVFQKRRFSLLYRHWNIWLGSIVFSLAAFGVLAFLNRGGSFGLSVIHEANALGLLRILATFALGALIAFPRATLTSFRGLALALWAVARTLWVVAHGLWWLAVQVVRPFRYLTRVASRPASSTPNIVVEKVFSPSPPSSPPPPTPVTVSPPHPEKVKTARPELEQTTREIWQKYTESQPRTDVAGWQLPSLDILDRAADVQIGEAETMRRAQIIEEALASYGVEAKVAQINVGPTVTQFGIEPGWDRKYKKVKEKDRDGNVRVTLQETSRTRVKVDRITSLANDLALALAAPSIRIEAPVPGKPVVGLEVPNSTFGLVSLRGVIESTAYQKLKARSGLTLALGKGAGARQSLQT